MEQGLRLLIQLVLEFAPVMVNLIQKRTAASLTTNNYQVPKVIQEFIQTVNTATQVYGFVAASEPEKIAKREQETALNLPEVHKIMDSWPLRLYPSQILESYPSYGHIPLKIFLAPPQVQFDRFDAKTARPGDIELVLAEGIRAFINQYYSLDNPVRPTEFLAGAWDSKRFHSEASIKAIFSKLKTQPTVILESENDGDYLNFRLAFWGLGQETYYYKTISRLPYREIVTESAKNRAGEWKKVQDELLFLGEDLAEIQRLGGENVLNLAVLEKSQKLQDQGIDITKLALEYQINHQDWSKLCQVLITCHCLVTAWIADAYHLIHYNVPPLLPELLPNLLKDALDLQSIEAIATGYKQVYQALQAEQHFWIPDLALQLAQSLSDLPNRSWSQEQVDYSINTWLELRQASAQDFSSPLEAMQSFVRIEDEEYVQKLKAYFMAVGDCQRVLDVERLLEEIAGLKDRQILVSVDANYTLTGHSAQVSSVAVSPDGKTLISGCADKTINVWNLNTGKLIRTFTGDLGEISSLAVSPNGNFLAVGSCDKSNVRVWYLPTGKLLHTLLGHQKPVNVVVISPDGQILASGSNKIKIWHLEKGDRICTLWHTSSVNAVAISPDGTILASGSSDTKIRLWNPRTGDPLRTFAAHRSEVTSITISPDGKLLFSGSADRTIKIWHLATGKLLQTLTGHSNQVKSITVSPDGQTLWSGSADKTIKMWRVATGELLHTFTGHAGTVNSVTLSADGKFLASGSSDHTIKIWQVVR
jgi:WD40 repeat protein